MSNHNKQPTIDYLQIFCMNFNSHWDLSGEKGRRNIDVQWAEQLDLQNGKSLAEIKQAQIEKIKHLKRARQIFEVFQVILDKTKDNKSRAMDILEYYAPTPIEKFCPLSVIAEQLISVGLVDSTIDVTELENILKVNYQKWLELAVKRSKETLLPDFPEIEKFEGQTGMIMMNGSGRWGPVRTVKGNYYQLLSSL